MMQTKLTRESFHVFQANARNALKQSEQVPAVLICAGTGCIAGGAMKIYENIKAECERRGLSVYVGLKHDTDEEKSLHVKMSGCHGFCEMGPLVHIEPMGVMYIHVTPEDCHEILERTVLGGEIIDRLVYHLDGVAYPRQADIPFYKKQHRVVLENCGSSDAEDIEEYIAKGGYAAFEKALFEMTGEEICKNITDSGLRGRGGGGFPAGRKWEGARKQTSAQKYVVCNGDEGDPGAFMDRSIMEGNPHSVLEGMMIAGLAVGSDTGYIYVRAEYPLAVNRLKTAIAKAEAFGLLGDHIMGSDFSFRIHVNRGAGAFVCGEGSALTASIEGSRGMPRVKPPRTIEHGLWAEPTVLNNVETFANVPLIIRNGVEWYRSIGTKTSPGTKAFALTGNVVNTGLIEVPMGTTIREVVFDIGGGIRNGKKFKAVQIGGPSGGATTASKEHLDLPLDFDSLKSIGAMIGSGGLVVMDEDTCMVETARFFMEFTQKESCGKCVPCREGTKRMLEILDRIIANKGTLEDLDLLEELADTITHTALCGLGQSACKPVQSTLKYFRNEYLAHVVDHHCPICNREKPHPTIDADKCKGCGKCRKNCPMEAISGAVKQPHTIDPERCVNCGACVAICPFGAITAAKEG
ncbi:MULTISPECIES: NADH-ubiquinone oxidoreductase-F iron-sulfur binding region domain-containing protein [environmental samples]|uniref:NADH-ubiquinone oxidoreductase-F iron-sulfur binding region domain-containing protein n=1 Tax=Oscillibacter sp. CAG:155 TaxID=1262910 RepID=UPI0003409283|nr:MULTISPECIES: NADH-ubiquinone oxidoreductase-F iron-sulfur binding region domain-containing protein [environmental samples]CDC68668.1 putative uptake hydrogenase subunit HupB [Oscillibacter sp. CAG:155]